MLQEIGAEHIPQLLVFNKLMPCPRAIAGEAGGFHGCGWRSNSACICQRPQWSGSVLLLRARLAEIAARALPAQEPATLTKPFSDRDAL